MLEFIQKLWSADGFMPHGHCYLWNPALIWLHVTSDALIALAYTSIPFTLIHFIQRRKDLPFHWMFLCFGAFIVACGATHAMEIVTLWTPVYWASGFIKAITAIASVPTAILLIRLVPRALALPSPEALRAAHVELRAAHADLEQRVQERMRAEMALKNANRELEAFSYSVAHDLRAPLRAMSGFAQMLLEDHARQLDGEGRECLDEIVQNAAKMGGLIDALLSLARVSRVEPRSEPVDLAALARSVVAQLTAGDPSRSVELVAPEHLWAHLDANLARTMVENLVGNAWKFTAGVKQARIEIGRAGDDFFVKDNGAGFDPAYAGKLFAPFQRLHSVSQFPGTGIGLATVQRILHRHGGSIRAEGAVGAGATFYFSLHATLTGEAT